MPVPVDRRMRLISTTRPAKSKSYFRRACLQPFSGYLVAFAWAIWFDLGKRISWGDSAARAGGAGPAWAGNLPSSLVRSHLW